MKNIFNNYLGFVHKDWHNFCDYLKRHYYVLKNGIKKDFTKSKLKYKILDFNAIRGYKAMVKFEKYAKKHTNIKIIKCDDNVFASSLICLIPHLTMGVTLWCLPQCAEEQGIMFLHPKEIDNLIKELKKIKKFIKG